MDTKYLAFSIERIGFYLKQGDLYKAGFNNYLLRMQIYFLLIDLDRRG